MKTTIRQIARQDPDVFHFVSRWMGMRISRTRWTVARELCRIWWHEHRNDDPPRACA